MLQKLQKTNACNKVLGVSVAANVKHLELQAKGHLMLQLQLPLHSQLLQHASQSCHPALDTLIKPVRVTVTVTVTVSEWNVVIAFN